MRTLCLGTVAGALGLLLSRDDSIEPSEAFLEPIVNDIDGLKNDDLEPDQKADQGEGRQWSLRADGWYIQVDRPTVELVRTSPAELRFTPEKKISQYDSLVAKHARAHGLDWRLISALIYEESRFKPDSRSRRGAYGLMQVMPIAAEAVGSERFESPDDNIRTGVSYLKHLLDRYRAAPSGDRLRLALAAYNMGPGHLQDAQTLAEQLNKNPLLWRENLEITIPMLETPDDYHGLKYGYAQGSQTVRYVERIMERYQYYRSEVAGGLVSDRNARSTSLVRLYPDSVGSR